jgi:hypothetical protein
MSSTETQPEVELPLAENPKALGLVSSGIEQVMSGKITLSDLLASVAEVPDKEVADKKPPVPPALSEKVLEALKRLPEVYGQVVVTVDRKLTPKELATITEERDLISVVLDPLKKRKDESIREVLANHFDNILTDEQKEAARKDAKGHFAIKQHVSVEGLGRKVQRSVSGGKPKLSIAHIEALHKAGQIDRKTYLAITKKPDVPRVLDEDGLHKAIQKDPALFFLLGSVAEPTTPTTTIRVDPDN